MLNSQVQPQLQAQVDNKRFMQAVSSLLRINALHDLPRLVDGEQGIHFADAIALADALETIRQYVNTQNPDQHHFPPSHHCDDVPVGRGFLK